MKAIVMERFGAPDVLVERDIADPVLGPGDALIAVGFASVTFVETQIRAGNAPRAAMLPALPAVPGNGVGGVVAEVGADVGRQLIGVRIVSTTGGTGGYAELAVVPAAGLIPVPDELAMDEAVALLADGRTALGLMERAAVQSGETVLVEAAAGGVGSLLVQLAKSAGARVVAVAGGERKLQTAQALGADVVVDYDAPSWAAEVAGALNGSGVDVVFDGVGGAIGRAAVGRLRPVIGQKVPLANAADAHRAIEARGTIGKTLLVP
jgi:NADPH2:quinone reductase